MKLGLVALNGFYPFVPIGGPAIASYEMTEGLSRLGHEVLVLTSSRTTEANELDLMKNVTANVIRTKLPVDLLEMNLRTMSLLKDFERCDLIHYNGPPIGLDIMWPAILRFSGRPQTYWYCGDVHNYPLRFSLFLANQRFLDKILVNCRFLHSFAQNVGISSDRLEYMPMGVDLERFRRVGFRKLEGEPALLYVGRLSADKDIMTLFAAFKAVQVLLPNSRLHLVGSGPIEEECRALAENLGIYRRTIWHGAKDRSVLPKYYKGSDIVVYPIAQQLSTGMGLVAMEALASRKPLITSIFAGNQEFLRQNVNAILVPMSDHKALANRIVELWQNEDLAQRISTNGYNYIKEFDWKNILSKLIRVWEPLIGQKSNNDADSASLSKTYPLKTTMPTGNSLDLPGCWQTRKNLVYPVADVPAVAHNGKIYIFGGYGNGPRDIKNYVQAYNPSFDTWTVEVGMPTARWGAAAAALNGLIYVFGGSVGDYLIGCDKCEAYDPNTGSWRTMTPTPAAVSKQGLEAVTVGSYIYLFYDKATYRFDPSGNGCSGSYAVEADAPIGTNWAVAAYVQVEEEDRVYLIGGYDLAAEAPTDANRFYRPLFNDWSSTQAEAPVSGFGMAREGPTIGGTIYYIMGQRNSGPFHRSIYAYDAASNRWKAGLARASYGRDGLGAGVVNGKIYALGGRNTRPGVGLDWNEEFDPN
jgi:glycosyltransferase involved in cell wall biosynthesis